MQHIKNRSNAVKCPTEKIQDLASGRKLFSASDNSAAPGVYFKQRSQHLAFFPGKHLTLHQMPPQRLSADNFCSLNRLQGFGYGETACEKAKTQSISYHAEFEIGFQLASVEPSPTQIASANYFLTQLQ